MTKSPVVKQEATIFDENLDELQNLLIWQEDYAFEALERASSGGAETAQLGELYSVTHARDVAHLFREQDTLPFSKDQTSEHDGLLIAPQEGLPLSIVVMTRNDTHVERMEDRTQAFIDSVFFLAEKHQTRLELIIVEWNPQADRPSMKDQFRYPPNHAFVTCRIITVGPEIHARYIWSGSLPVYQMIAKNVGIRRARGEFILVTNIDILLSEELFKQVTSGDLEPGQIYRSNRWDVDRAILDAGSPQEQLDAAEEMTFQINYREGIYPKGQKLERLKVSRYSHFLRYESSNVYQLHTEACGDFQMLHRDDWARVRGYSEIDAYSFHVDSLFAVTCHHAGLKEVVLSGPHFHIDHTLGVKIKSDTYEINERAAIKHLSLAVLCMLDRFQEVAGDFYLLNDEAWGLSGYELPDEAVSMSGSDSADSIVTRVVGGTSPSSLTTLEKIGDPMDIERLRTYFARVWNETASFVTEASAGRDLYIWGAGSRGLYTASALTTAGVSPKAFIHGGFTQPRVKDHAVIGAAEFLKKTPDEAFVIIASVFADDIHHRLSESAWLEGRDYIIGM